ncbi:tumor necrosis factor receptor superfamily member 6B isoform X2 [Embiotoca jacksoni]|uniref:tumor necrosis factor receptor superfamily member 6B isoform X2 n=1 Tax=Embiotoca jacksoni TaxID=100190 RepID=UPI0037041D38
MINRSQEDEESSILLTDQRLSSFFTMMPKSPLGLLLLLLLSTRTAPVRGDPSPLLTFEDRDPITGASVQCDRCQPGTYLRASCSSTNRSDCAPCPRGSFTAHWNYISKCLRCGVCGNNEVETTGCSADTDCSCECKPGFYFRRDYDMCWRHRECASGSGVASEGTAHHDTVCQTCSNGTFSTFSSGKQNCTEHRQCDAAGLKLVLCGATWHDSVCANCSQIRDDAVYLREIIPAFFVHHKMHLKRLRRVVHKLPSADGRKRETTSDLDLPVLHERIGAWATSATPQQVRELLVVLKKLGASGTGERLQKKLQRINTHLKERCVSGSAANDFTTVKTEVKRPVL